MRSSYDHRCLVQLRKLVLNSLPLMEDVFASRLAGWCLLGYRACRCTATEATAAQPSSDIPRSVMPVAGWLMLAPAAKPSQRTAANSPANSISCIIQHLCPGKGGAAQPTSLLSGRMVDCTAHAYTGVSIAFNRFTSDPHGVSLSVRAGRHAPNGWLHISSRRFL